MEQNVHTENEPLVLDKHSLHSSIEEIKRKKRLKFLLAFFLLLGTIFMIVAFTARFEVDIDYLLL
jgi:hypothetical protein